MKNYLFKAILIMTIFLIFSCSMGKIGYAVILWSENPDLLKTGEILPVYDESNMRNTFTVKTKSTKELIEIEKYRAVFLKNKKAANKYKTKYSKYINTYAVVEKTGLPVREYPDNNAKRIYKLRNQQILKVISKSEKTDTISDLEDYWYEVLTKDGTQGFCFGHALKIFNSSDKKIEKLGIEETDDTLKDVLTKKWRPYYYREMINTGRIVLPQFRDDYFLEFRPDEKELEFKLPGKSRVFKYNKIEAIQKGKYLFDGPNIRLYVKSENSILLNYYDSNREINEDFVFIEADINEIIEKMKEKISNSYNRIRNIGTVLSSSAYGNITLNDNFTFSWENYQRLVPDVINQGFGKNGEIVFSYFTTIKLKSEFDGVISFRFHNSQASKMISFLYKIENNGIKLTFVPEKYIDNNLIKDKPGSSIVLFFTGNGS